METYIKNTNQIEADNVESPYLLQLKSYLKIIKIPYIMENTNTFLSLDMVESISRITTFPTILPLYQDLELSKYHQDLI